MVKLKNNKNWWQENYGFFGKFYMQGDNSIEGYHENKKMSLQERTKEEVFGIIKLCALKRGDHVLDCPTGYGRHAIALAKQGIQVTGSDINSVELNIAKITAKHEKVNLKFVKENMIALRYKKEFDVVINMWYSFGFFNTDRENFKVLKNLYNATKKGGKFLMHTDVNMPKVFSGKFREFEKRNLPDGGILRIVEFYNQKTKRNYGVWIIENGNKVEIRDYSVRVYTKEEFVGLCRRAGFSDVKVYSDWNGGKYNNNSDDMIVVATK